MNRGNEEVESMPGLLARLDLEQISCDKLEIVIKGWLPSVVSTKFEQ